jgi:hypothetical protein
MPQLRIALPVVIVLAATPVLAQEAAVAPACHGTSPVRVVMTPVDGPSFKGTFLCLSGDQVVLARDGRVTATDLASVRRIETPADPIWDGAVKGAAIPLIAWLVFSDGSQPEWMLRSVAAYASIGTVIDALNRNKTTIYDRGPRAAVGWRIRF